MIILASFFPSCNQASLYFGIPFLCTKRDQMVFTKHMNEQSWLFYPLLSNKTVYNQFTVDLENNINNINQSYINTVVHQYKQMCFLNEYNLPINLCGQTFTLNYKQLNTGIVLLNSIINNVSLDSSQNYTRESFLEQFFQNSFLLIINDNQKYPIICNIQNNISFPYVCPIYYREYQQNTLVGSVTFFGQYNIGSIVIPEKIIGQIQLVRDSNQLLGQIQYKDQSKDQSKDNEILFQSSSTIYHIPMITETPYNLNFSIMGIQFSPKIVILLGVFLGLCYLFVIVYIVISYKQSNSHIHNIMRKQNKMQ